MYTVYILKSRAVKKNYVGITIDLSRRIREHNSGKNFYTQRHCPWDLIYTEKFNNQEDVLKREKYLKSATGRRFLKKYVFKENA